MIYNNIIKEIGESLQGPCIELGFYMKWYIDIKGNMRQEHIFLSTIYAITANWMYSIQDMVLFLLTQGMNERGKGTCKLQRLGQPGCQR